MKKIAYCVILFLIVSVIIGVGFMIDDGDYLLKKQNMSDVPGKDSDDIGDKDSEPARAGSQGSGIEGTNVRHSAISGYMMIAEDDDVNIYEMYENGYLEKIRELDIDPEYMRSADRTMLKQGIITDSYEEICSLIEDFSS